MSELAIWTENVGLVSMSSLNIFHQLKFHFQISLEESRYKSSKSKEARH